eukprot:gb/GECH01000720.1/.p1 GENE.gb/GECH01000720.1/~~gb/GECH01000720.1/.p1  ORF type:complete len:568 (+),score=113.96 gb/GECH01000720.1/:1-1704(+)
MTLSAKQQRRIKILASHLNQSSFSKSNSTFPIIDQQKLQQHYNSNLENDQNHHSSEKDFSSNNTTLEVPKQEVTATTDVKLENKVSWSNLLVLFLISQLLGHTRIISTFVNPLTSKYGISQTHIAAVFSFSCFCQALGFFIGRTLSYQIGVKNTSIIGGMLLSFGVIACTSFLSFKNSSKSSQSPSLSSQTLRWKHILGLILSYGVVGSSGSGLMEGGAFINMLENFPNRRRLVLSFFLGSTSAAPLWMAPVFHVLLQQLGVEKTLVVLSLWMLFTIPFFKLIRMNHEIFAKDQIPERKKQIGKRLIRDEVNDMLDASLSDSQQSKRNNISDSKQNRRGSRFPKAAQKHSIVSGLSIVIRMFYRIFKQFSKTPQFLAFTFILFGLFAGRITIYNFGTTIARDIGGMGPGRAALLISAVSLAATISRLVSGYVKIKTPLRKAVSTTIWTQISALASLSLLEKWKNPSNNEYILFTKQILVGLSMLLFTVAVAFGYPLRSGVLTSLQTYEEKRLFIELQSLVTLLGALFPVFSSWLQQRRQTGWTSTFSLLMLFSFIGYILHKRLPTLY